MTFAASGATALVPGSFCYWPHLQLSREEAIVVEERYRSELGILHKYARCHNCYCRFQLGRNFGEFACFAHPGKYQWNTARAAHEWTCCRQTSVLASQISRSYDTLPSPLNHQPRPTYLNHVETPPATDQTIVLGPWCRKVALSSDVGWHRRNHSPLPSSTMESVSVRGCHAADHVSPETGLSFSLTATATLPLAVFAYLNHNRLPSLLQTQGVSTITIVGLGEKETDDQLWKRECASQLARLTKDGNVDQDAAAISSQAWESSTPATTSVARPLTSLFSEKNSAACLSAWLSVPMLHEANIVTEAHKEEFVRLNANLLYVDLMKSTVTLPRMSYSPARR